MKGVESDKQGFYDNTNLECFWASYGSFLAI